LALFLFFEKPLEIYAADSRGGGIKASAHLDFFAHLIHLLRRNVESFRLAVNQYRDLILRVQVFAVGTMTVGPAAGTFAFDKRAGQHFAEITEAADEFAAQFQVGFDGRQLEFPTGKAESAFSCATRERRRNQGRAARGLWVYRLELSKWVGLASGPAHSGCSPSCLFASR